MGGDESKAGKFKLPFVNIEVGEYTTIWKLAEIDKKGIGYKSAISFDTTKPDGTPRKLLPSTAGWSAKTSSRTGLHKPYTANVTTGGFNELLNVTGTA